jgi:hypothetical protein
VESLLFFMVLDLSLVYSKNLVVFGSDYYSIILAGEGEVGINAGDISLKDASFSLVGSFSDIYDYFLKVLIIFAAISGVYSFIIVYLSELESLDLVLSSFFS